MDPSTQSQSPPPPVAKKVEHAMEMFGDVRIGNYYWLRDDSRTDPEVLSYLHEENAYTDSIMSATIGEPLVGVTSYFEWAGDNALVYVMMDEILRPDKSGGGEMGRQWYENGKLLKKKNTFTDFIACAEYLIEKNSVLRKDCIEGRSAGGLLIGAVLNMRPDLCKAAVAGVPFVDVVTTMLDPTIPLTTSEWEEWDDPRKEEFYFYMKSYSPVDNAKAQNYPNILVTEGLNDTRVLYSEPAKFVAKLRKSKIDDNILLFKCEFGAGHSSKSER
ncbi:Protease 2 [Glycine soja]|nr:Protease 2 [Glycine soja]